MKLPDDIYADRTAYAADGSVLVFYAKKEGSEKKTGAAVMKDDGTGFRSIYEGPLEKKLLPYQDNTRILTGDSVLECPAGTTFETCPENSLTRYEIVYPDEFTKDPEVTRIFSEVIIAPDNVHMAWTMLRKDCGAADAVGSLVKTEKDGKIVKVDLDKNAILIKGSVPGNKGSILKIRKTVKSSK